MRVLIACEFSGIVRDAFRKRGHDAWSLDIIPSENGGNHLLMSVESLLYDPREWDLIIAHPPCTYLCNSGVRWLTNNPQRQRLMRAATKLFKRCLSLDAPRIAVENPIPHKHAQLPPYQQIIQPWQFGHGETKATCLWLKNLPLLTPTNIVDGRHARVHREPPSAERWKNRSRTMQGIADAMAEQWGKL